MSALAKYDAMCAAIDAAYQVDEVKDIRDKAVALEEYSTQAKNTEAERRACEIRLRAERKAGQLLASMEKAKGAREPGTGRGTTRSPEGTASKLNDLGISKKQSSNWQKLAAVPEKKFERALADTTHKPTTTGIIKENEEPKQRPVADNALWLWGRLNDFERLEILSKTPAEVMETMTPEMLDEVHALAPKVAAWLLRIGKCEASRGFGLRDGGLDIPPELRKRGDGHRVDEPVLDPNPPDHSVEPHPLDIPDYLLRKRPEEKPSC
jgi:hypothetical protein